MLKDLAFLPFARQDFKNRDEDDKLEMTCDGKNAQSDFEKRLLNPVLAEFLTHSDWKTFEEDLQEWHSNLKEDQVAKFLEVWRKWSCDQKRKREEKEKE